jgi:hypothetical protein
MGAGPRFFYCELILGCRHARDPTVTSVREVDGFDSLPSPWPERIS